MPRKPRIIPTATPESLRHDEWILRWSREYLAEPDVVTVVPVIGPHSVDIIVIGIDRIRFVEVKGAKAQLTPLEKRVQQVVKGTPLLTYELRRYG